MPLIVNWRPKKENKEIVMGGEKPSEQKADTPAPNENPEGVITKSDSVGNAVEEAKQSFQEDVAKRGSKQPSKQSSKKQGE